MKKKLTLLALTLMSISCITNAACPNLEGRYTQCYSEIRKVKGDYIINQYQESNYEVYNVEYIDDETGENRKDLIKTNNQVETRKETIPRIGIKVKLEAKSNCINNSVVSDAEAFYLGKKVGTFVSSISLERKTLKSRIDGSYLGREVHKLIICDLQE